MLLDDIEHFVCKTGSDRNLPTYRYLAVLRPKTRVEIIPRKV